MSISPQQARRLAEMVLDGPDPDSEDSRSHPRQVGRYRLVGVLGSGGMGTVYRAEQDSPSRIVAVKILKRGLVSRSALRRFEHEAEVLARLHHPAIAQIYEAETWDDGSGGVPYFAMEYVPGARAITDYAAATGLGTRARLDLFALVCDAVHHGHQKGVIHRDLKPANILVDEEGHPKVIDFGVARASDADLAVTTLRTDAGKLVGTLQYMSPEQCLGNSLEIDTRSDVYSLGVVLFELLCGVPPYDLSDTSIPGAARIIQEQEPGRPGTIARSLRGDVEAITLKALEKRRENRYQSAAELAADVRRHLAREPIDARRPGAWARTVRWITRHPVLTTAAAAVVIGLLSGGLTAVLATYELNYRPHHFSLATDGRVAYLHSLSNRIVHEWTSDAADGIKDGAFLREDALAILSFSRFDRSFGGALCAFDTFGDRRRPVWTDRVAAQDMIAGFPASKYDPAGFTASWVEPIDIFPERNGLEIVAGFTHAPSSATVIRVYAADGDRLYQIWHDGPVGACHWMATPRLLVLLGQNAEVYWSERGHPGVRFAHPLVVFAVRPEIGHIEKTWTTPSPGGSTKTLAWYRCLLPPAALDEFTNWQLGDSGDDESVLFGLSLARNPHAGIGWRIDETGATGPYYTSDNWKLDPEVPDPEVFYLGDLPPVVGHKTGAPASGS